MYQTYSTTPNVLGEVVSQSTGGTNVDNSALGGITSTNDANQGIANTGKTAKQAGNTVDTNNNNNLL